MNNYSTSGYQNIAIAVEAVATRGIHYHIASEQAEQTSIVIFATVAECSIKTIVARNQTHAATFNGDKGSLKTFNRIGDLQGGSAGGN